MTPLLFYTCADRYYHRFVCPYILTALITNPDAKVEVLVRGYNEFVKSYDLTMLLLQKEFGAKFLIRSIDNYELSDISNSFRPDKVRWLIQPMLKSTTTYITDIDFLFIKDSSQLYEWGKSELKRCNAFCTPYEREKPDDKRVSGVLFVDGTYFDRLSKIDTTVINKLSYKILQEEIFFKQLLLRLGPDLKMDSVKNRKLLAYHFSLNHKPFTSFNCSGNKDEFMQLLDMTNHPLWREFIEYFGDDFNDVFNAHLEYRKKELGLC